MVEVAMLLAYGGGFVGEDNDDEKGRSGVIEYIPMTLAVDDDLSDGLTELRLNSDRWTAWKGYNDIKTMFSRQ